MNAGTFGMCLRQAVPVPNQLLVVLSLIVSKLTNTVHAKHTNSRQPCQLSPSKPVCVKVWLLVSPTVEEAVCTSAPRKGNRMSITHMTDTMRYSRKSAGTRRSVLQAFGRIRKHTSDSEIVRTGPMLTHAGSESQRLPDVGSSNLLATVNKYTLENAPGTPILRKTSASGEDRNCNPPSNSLRQIQRNGFTAATVHHT